MSLSLVSSNSIGLYGSAFNFVNKAVFSEIIHKVSEVYESSKSLFNTHSSKVIGFTGDFLGGVGGVAAIYTMFKGFERVFSKQKLASQIEGGLTVVESMGGVATSAVSVGEGLEKVAVITKNSLGWVSAISFFGAVLSAASIINSTKKCYESYKFSQNLELLKKSETCYKLALDSLRDMEGVKKHIQLSKKELISKIDNLIDQKESVEEKEVLSEKIYETLKGRVQSKINSEALSVLAGIVSLIGSAILFATPAAPVALALVGIATAISIGQFMCNWQNNKEFELMLTPEST